MGGNIRRGRRRRRGLPRYARLAIFLAALVLLIVGIVALARGCTRSADVVAAGSIVPQATPDAYKLEEPIETSAPTEAPAAEATAPAAKTGGNRTCTIRSIGDIVIDDGMLKMAKSSGSYDFAPFLALIAPSMAKADYTVLNVDGPLCGKGSRAGYYGYPQFNTPPQLLYALKDCGVDMLTLANNHALDNYFDGLKATIDNVEKVGMSHVGAYRTQEEYDTPRVVDINGIKVGFLNYTTGTNTMERYSDAAATEYGLRMPNNSNAKADVDACRAAGAEIVIAYMHWGEEYKRTPTSDVKKMAQKMVKAGVDVIVGGHPHMVQTCEWLSVDGDDGRKTALVLYSMGNFLTEHRLEFTDSGIIFEFTLREDPATGKIDVVDPKYVPVYVWRTGAKGSYNYRAVAIGDVMGDRPADMNDSEYNRAVAALDGMKALFANSPVTAVKD